MGDKVSNTASETFVTIYEWINGIFSTLIWGGAQSYLPYGIGALFLMISTILVAVFIFKVLYWAYGAMMCHYGKNWFEEEGPRTQIFVEGSDIKDNMRIFVFSRTMDSMKFTCLLTIMSMLFTFLLGYLIGFLFAILLLMAMVVIYHIIKYYVLFSILVGIPILVLLIRRRSMKAILVEEKLSKD